MKFSNLLSKLALVCVATFFGFITPAYAMLEVRGHFGMITASPSDLNNAVSGQVGNNDLNVSGATMYGADAIVKFPLSSFGIGLRYENWDQKKTTSNYVLPTVNGTGEMTMNNFSGVLIFRPIDTLAYLGFIGTYGISSDIHYKLGANSISTLSDYKASSSTVYSVGAEGGLKLGFLRLGAEVGYESVTGSGMKNTMNQTVSTADLKMAGPYGRIVLGFGI